MKGPLILVVDDDDSIGENIQELLNLEGYESLLAKDGIEALTILRRETDRKFSLILLDLQMPRMNGLEFLAEFASLPPQTSRVPVLVLTAGAAAQPAGVAGLIRKPFEYETFLRLLKRHCA
jgi:CheY-like chemotaxis protein